MRRARVRFAEEGDLGWQAWDDSHPVPMFGDGATHTAHGPRDAALALWAVTVPSRESTAASAPADGSPSRATEPRSVVWRLRPPGAVPRRR
jgi:para-nitrobenzyl esterase